MDRHVSDASTAILRNRREENSVFVKGILIFEYLDADGDIHLTWEASEISPWDALGMLEFAQHVVITGEA